MTPGWPKMPRLPVLASIGMSSMARGTRKGVAGSSFRASFMKSATMGATSSPPVRPLPMGLGLSNPTKVPTTRSGVKPMNQASRSSFDVPVLPATGLPTTWTFLPVPRSTTPSIIEVIW